MVLDLDRSTGTSLLEMKCGLSLKITADPTQRGSQPPPILEITVWNAGERIVSVIVYVELMCTLCVL